MSVRHSMTESEELAWVQAYVLPIPDESSRKEARMNNGTPTHEEREEALREYFAAGGVLVAVGNKFIITQKQMREIDRCLAGLGLRRSPDQIKPTHTMASDLRFAESSLRRIIARALHSAGEVGNINQWQPAALAIYVRVDEKTKQAIMDGDERRSKWQRHVLDKIVEGVPDRPQETQPNVSGYAAQAFRQIAIVRGLPKQLVGPPPPALPAGKDANGD